MDERLGRWGRREEWKKVVQESLPVVKLLTKVAKVGSAEEGLDSIVAEGEALRMKTAAAFGLDEVVEVAASFGMRGEVGIVHERVSCVAGELMSPCENVAPEKSRCVQSQERAIWYHARQTP